jgi:purine-cytosine permease-like protein
MSDESTQPAAEYEREPVPPHALLGFKSFVGMFAGEHTAGTELMIGPLFVAHGVSAFDLIVGLAVGNALAVLSWLLLVTPIATRARLTLYYQLEQICGRKLVTLYNLANGILFCMLAGAMITVSATAVGVWFQFPMPGLNDLYPNSVGWVVAVAAVGLAIAVVAAYGYNTVAHVANIAAPWMLLVFLAFGVIGLQQFIAETNTQIQSAADLWQLAQTAIWTGGTPLAGNVKFTFWHVMFFAWFCNTPVHIGMSDLTIFRYARKSWYGLASAAGMYLGHYVAWTCASVMYALQLHRTPDQTDVLPGPMSYAACGLAGVLCVIAAGWTTANPTIYRAGLAFQAIAPRASRFRVTLLTGLAATVAGAFPAVTMKLLEFVALFGLVLMPMGAVIFMDFWLLKRLGLRDNYAARTGTDFHWAAAITWCVTFVACLALVQSDVTVGGVKPFQIYFVCLPGWFVAAVLYIVCSVIIQRGAHNTRGFRRVAQLVSWLSFAATIAPAFLFLAGSIDLEQTKLFTALATLVWFIATPLWMGRRT